MHFFRIPKYVLLYVKHIMYGKSRDNIPSDSTYTLLCEHDYMRVSSCESTLEYFIPR